MKRQTIFIIAALVAVYIMTRHRGAVEAEKEHDREADAEWANEGGANAPATV